MILKPTHDKVIVKRRDSNKVSRGGIVIVSEHEKPSKGDVVAVGPGRYLGETLIETTLKEGDVVIFGENAGDEVEVDDTTYVVMNEREVLAVIDEQ